MPRKRSSENLKIDRVTEKDRLSDANLETSVVTIPKKSPKVALNMRIEPEIITLVKQIAETKHLDGYTQLLRLYIREGIERDRSLIE